MSFVLDTGVNKVILFDINDRISLKYKRAKSVELRGLGNDGYTKALRSDGNVLKIGDIINTNQNIYGIFDESLNFTPRLGMEIHGIIGYDLFRDYIVELNYSSKFLRLHHHEWFIEDFSGKWQSFPISIVKNKPYLDLSIQSNGKHKEVTLLMDTGSSDALWLFKNEEDDLFPHPDLSFYDYLGKGLSGNIYGERSKIEALHLGEFSQSQVNVAYPDSSYVHLARNNKERHGSISGNLLKRFNIFFDYLNEKIHLKKNRFFKEAYTYNNSGIVVEQGGPRFVKEYKKPVAANFAKSGNNFTHSSLIKANTIHYTLRPSFVIVEVRRNSNAALAGILPGDQLLSINGQETYKMKLQEIIKLLHGRTGDLLRLRLQRNGEEQFIKFLLEDVFQKKDPQTSEGLE